LSVWPTISLRPSFSADRHFWLWSKHQKWLHFSLLSIYLSNCLITFQLSVCLYISLFVHLSVCISAWVLSSNLSFSIKAFQTFIFIFSAIMYCIIQNYIAAGSIFFSSVYLFISIGKHCWDSSYFSIFNLNLRDWNVASRTCDVTKPFFSFLTDR
jgi:hypothetical protein